MEKVPDQNYFQKILVAVDGSRASLLAQELAVVLAKKLQSEVTVVHAVPEELLDLAVRPVYADIPKQIVEEISEWFVQKGEEIVANARALFSEEGVKVDARLLHGDAAEKTISLAIEEKYDLIIIGNRGETEAETFSLGSTAEKICRHAVCSVLIIKETTEIAKILAAIDGSESGNKAFLHAVQLGQKIGSKVTVMHVVEPGLFGLRSKVGQEIGERILSKAADEIRGAQVAKRLEVGSSSEKIIEIATKESYDLIVLGSRGLSSARRFLLGSVSDDISHHAQCSVLIVK